MLQTLFNRHWPKAIFFDLDGTLIDSLPDLSKAVDAMLIELNYQPAGLEKAGLWVGNGSIKLAQRALADAMGATEQDISQADLDCAHTSFLKQYEICKGQFSKVYPGVIDTLTKLKALAIQLCIITNKPKRFTPHVLEQHELDNFFELVLSGDTLAEKKPHAAPLLFALQHFNLAKDQVVMIGDSSSDIEAANAAGVKSVCVTYGYNHGNNPKDLAASSHIDSFPQLLA